MRGRFAVWPDASKRTAPVVGGEAYVVYPMSGARVEHDDGTVSPVEFTYVETPDDPLLPMYVVECTHGEDSLPRIDAVHVVRRPDGREVRSVDLRRLRPLEELIEDAWDMASFRPLLFIGDTEHEVQVSMDRALATEPAEMRKTIRGLRQKARRTITPKVLAEVARIYREHLSTGAPTKAVAEHFGIAPSTASLYVKRARDAALDMDEED
jgi:hypothetical protein